MVDFETPIPMGEEELETDDPMSALMALSREQQRRREEALARLRDLSQQHGTQAQGLRSVALLSSFGQNPLLQGLQREAGAQSAQLQGMAMQAEGRADGTERGGVDPLGFARLQQMAEHQRKQQELAEQKLAQQTETAAAKAQAAKDKAAGGATAKAQTAEEKRAEKLWKDTESLRKEFTNLPDVKDFTEFDAAYKGLQSALKRPGGVGSAAAIFSFMKLIDPGVAVMEGDVERIRAASGPAAKFADLYEYAKSGNTLPETVRKELGGMADDLYGLRKERHEARREQYRGLAKKRGMDPESVLPPMPSPVQRIPATQALPSGPAGSLLLESPPGKTGGTGELVKVVSPDGKPGRIPRANLEKAKAKGYKEVP